MLNKNNRNSKLHLLVILYQEVVKEYDYGYGAYDKDSESIEYSLNVGKPELFFYYIDIDYKTDKWIHGAMNDKGGNKLAEGNTSNELDNHLSKFHEKPKVEYFNFDPEKLPDFWEYTIEPKAVYTIKESYRKAWELSKEVGQSVLLKFNGNLYKIHYSYDPDASDFKIYSFRINP